MVVVATLSLPDCCLQTLVPLSFVITAGLTGDERPQHTTLVYAVVYIEHQHLSKNGGRDCNVQSEHRDRCICVVFPFPSPCRVHGMLEREQKICGKL